MHEIHLEPRSAAELAGVVPPDRLAALLDDSAVRLRTRLGGRSVINVNSSGAGGGVAEMLTWMIPYIRGAEIDARWFVIDGDPALFDTTKRIHLRLHGHPGDGGPLGPPEADHIREIGRANAERFASSIVPGDVVVVHDPQPVGLVPILASWGVPIVWRCHIGAPAPNKYSEQAWEFLRPFLEDHVDTYVFTREDYAPAWVPRNRLEVIRPSIDPLSPKNEHLDARSVIDTLRHVGIVDGGPTADVGFPRPDRTTGHIRHYADIIRTGPPPEDDDPLVVQVSRWDPLKDMRGVMHAFVDHVLDKSDAHLVLAGPVVTSVADDPGAVEELEAAWTEWRQLPHHARRRVQLVCLPMSDPDENGAIVNALQRHAAVVVQKSLAEGFGLTVTEAMFKNAAVVASHVGGLADQIEDGVDGRLMADPTDLAAFGAAVLDLLGDDAARTEMGVRARASVVEQFLPDSALREWVEAVLAAIDHHQERGTGGKVPS